MHLLGWRDRDLPWALVAGFTVVGDIDACGVHKPVAQDTARPVDNALAAMHGMRLTRHEELRQGLLGEHAVEYIHKLEANRSVHVHAAEILDATQKEIDLGLARPLETKAEVDRIFGIGQWRPLPRHVVHQNGKFRPIDDARASSHNAYTECAESIVCSSAEWPAIVTKAVLKQIDELNAPSAGHPPGWLQPRTGTADMWKGFRQNHPTKEDECFCVITFVHPETRQRVYSRLRGLPFGMGSVVNQFNRLPHLQTAVKRRLLGLLVCHYFDDELTWEVDRISKQSHRLGSRLSSLWGIIYSEDKRQHMSTSTDFLGSQYDWSRFTQDRAV